MNAPTTLDSAHLPPEPAGRTARSAAVVAVIWLALVVGSPLIVRYGPSPDDHAMAALATRTEAPRCVNAPQFGAPAAGFPCGGKFLAASNARVADEPDL
jgi:hypothetical protein